MVGDPDVDIVVEVIGGIEPARSLIVDALMAGKPVVTANKELLGTHGRELFETAEGAGVDLLFEASVGGGIPLMRPLRESLAGDRIRRVMGIVNGTTNFILTRMTDGGARSTTRWRRRRRSASRSATPPPTSRASTPRPRRRSSPRSRSAPRVAAERRVPRGHHRRSRSTTSRRPRDLGYVVKLLAVAEELDGEIAVRVHPTMVPERHPLAAVRDSFNAVFIEGDAVGELMLYGRGAGGGPTASAVLGDLVDAAKNLVEGRKGATIGMLAAKPIRPIDEVSSQFYLLIEVADRPGVLAGDRHASSAARRVDPLDAAGGDRRRRAADLRHAQGARGRRPQDRRRPPRRRVRCIASARCCE